MSLKAFLTRIVVCAGFLVMVLIFCEQAGLTESFDDLHARYLSLRNTDVTVKKRKEWLQLAEELTLFADQESKHVKAPAAILEAAILYEQLYLVDAEGRAEADLDWQGEKSAGALKNLQRSIELLKRVPRDYPGDMLADDCLLRLGDLHLHVLKDQDSARRSYTEVVEAYPGSDMAILARAHLKDMAQSHTQTAVAKAPEPKLLTAQGVIEHKRKQVIVLDPGHGGEDFGAVSSSGLLEKDVALAVALELEELLTKRLGATVRLTRRADVFMPLIDRTTLANDFEADLFVSLHANASEKSNLSGLEVYYLDNSGDQSSRKLAERENSSMQFEGAQADLQYMLSDLIQNVKLDDSILLANLVEGSVISRLSGNWARVRSLGVKKAPFYVLVGAHMPCVLVEMFFIDHSVDGKNLAKRQFRSDLALGLFGGIEKFLTRQPS